MTAEGSKYAHEADAAQTFIPSHTFSRVWEGLGIHHAADTQPSLSMPRAAEVRASCFS